MYDVIREWPRYVKVPFPIAKVKIQPFDNLGVYLMPDANNIKRLTAWFCYVYSPPS